MLAMAFLPLFVVSLDIAHTMGRTLDASWPEGRPESHHLSSTWVGHLSYESINRADVKKTMSKQPLGALASLLLTFNPIIPYSRASASNVQKAKALGGVQSSIRSLHCARSSGLLCSEPKGGEAGATKVVWYVTEWFGRAASALRGTSPPEPPNPPPDTLDESIERLVADYAGTADDPRPYFLTGRMDVALYDPNCLFADPFVAFSGRDRFVANLENLAGGFITDSSTRMLSSVVERGDAAAGVLPSYTTKLLVKLRLGLPWQPVLAWPWGVKHIFDAKSGLIVEHVESWDVSAAEGVKQLFSPGANKKV